MSVKKKAPKPLAPKFPAPTAASTAAIAVVQQVMQANQEAGQAVQRAGQLAFDAALREAARADNKNPALWALDLGTSQWVSVASVQAQIKAAQAKQVKDQPKE